MAGGLLLSCLSTISFIALASGCASSDADADGGGGGTEAEIRQEQPLTVQNFVAHPRIVEVREAVKAIEDAIASGAFREERKENLCGPHSGGDILREKATDPAGIVRKLVLGASEPDVSATTTLYFSERGKLRFAFQTIDGGTGRGVSRHELRAYFNDAGERFWEVDRSATAPANAPLPDLQTRPFVVPARADALALPAAWEAQPGSVFAAPPSCL